jgi:hypothetical protein
MAGPVLPKPPAGVGGWSRVIVYLVETLAQGITWQLYQWGTPINHSQDPDPGEWRRFAFHFADTSSQDPADDQVFTMDFVNLTNGDVDSSWDAGDYADFDPAVRAFLTALAPLFANRLTCDYVNAYRMSFNPYLPPGSPDELKKPFADSGPPEHQFLINEVGTGQGQAPQVTSTVSEITLSRSHWGRMYLPNLATSSVAISGRLTNAAADAYCQAVHDLYDTMATLQFYAVVPTTQIDKHAARTLQFVNGVRVDDVVDVHRSRRHQHALYKKTLP